MPHSRARMFRFGAMGMEIASPIIAGAALGYYMDKYFNTPPYLMMVMCLLGVVYGFTRLIRGLKDLGED